MKTNQQPENNSTLLNLNIDDIIVSKTNPRVYFDEDKVKELATSIELHGVIQSITVRPSVKPGKYELIAGERRLRASFIARETKPERGMIPAIVKTVNDGEAREIQFIENLLREDVHPMDEAVAFKGYLDTNKMDVEGIAARIAKSTRYVANRLKLNDLISEFQKAFFENRLELVTAMQVCKMPSADQKELWNENFKGKTGALKIGKDLFTKYNHDLNNATFDTKNPDLIKEMGACTGCPFNSAGKGVLFANEGGAAICLNSSCFKKKTDLSFDINLAQALDTPGIVLLATHYGNPSEESLKLAKGTKIHNRYNTTEHSTPEKPDIEDYDVTDYENKKEMQKAFERDEKRYAEDLKEHNKKIASGKYLRAFVIEGNEKGAFVYMTFDRSEEKKATKADIKAKAETGDVTKEDLTAEIKRIQDNEKRKLELDEEKIYFSVFEELQKSDFKKNDKVLSKHELIGAIILLCERSAVSGYVEKELKLKNPYSGHFNHIVRRLEKEDAPALTKLFAQCLRVAILTVFSPSKSAPNQRPDVSGVCNIITHITNDYKPKEVAAIRLAQSEVADKRKERVKASLDKLNQQVKELGKKPIKPAKEPKSTGVNKKTKASKKK